MEHPQGRGRGPSGARAACSRIWEGPRSKRLLEPDLGPHGGSASQPAALQPMSSAARPWEVPDRQMPRQQKAVIILLLVSPIVCAACRPSHHPRAGQDV